MRRNPLHKIRKLKNSQKVKKRIVKKSFAQNKTKKDQIKITVDVKPKMKFNMIIEDEDEIVQDNHNNLISENFQSNNLKGGELEVDSDLKDDELVDNNLRIVNKQEIEDYQDYNEDGVDYHRETIANQNQEIKSKPILKKIIEVTKKSIKFKRTICFPDSILSKVQTIHLQNHLIGQLARIFCQFRINEVIILRDHGYTVKFGQLTPSEYLTKILQYLETP